MSPDFTPRRADGRSAGRVVYDYLAGRLGDETLDVGGVLTHDELASVLEVERNEADQWPAVYYQAIVAGSKELERVHHRHLRSRRGVGYIVAAGMGQIDGAKGKKKRATEAMKRAHKIALTTDMALVPTEDRRGVRDTQAAYANLVAVLKMHDERISDAEALIEALATAQVKDRTRVHYTEEQQREMADRLARVEARLDAAEGLTVDAEPDYRPPHLRRQAGAA